MRPRLFETVDSTYSSLGFVDSSWYRPSDGHVNMVLNFEKSDTGQIKPDEQEEPIDLPPSREAMHRIGRLVSEVEARLHASENDDQLEKEERVSYRVLYRQGLGRAHAKPSRVSRSDGISTVGPGNIHYHHQPGRVNHRDLLVCAGGSQTEIQVGQAPHPNQNLRDTADRIILHGLIPLVVPIKQRLGKTSLTAIQPKDFELIEINRHTLHRRPPLEISDIRMAALVGLQRYAKKV